jgi:hypothetical protein
MIRPPFHRHFCIINTLTDHGRIMTSQVIAIQKFRRDYLEKNAVGRWFVDRYYSASDVLVPVMVRFTKSRR